MSDELIDLILQMLKKDPFERIAIRKIYEHPWMMRYKENNKWSDSDDEEKKEANKDEKKEKEKRPASESTSLSDMCDELMLEGDDEFDSSSPEFSLKPQLGKLKENKILEPHMFCV